MRIAYLCDKKACADARRSCNGLWKNALCRHTTNPAHAVNGACKDPQAHPERFMRIDDDKYIEIEK